MYSHRLAIGAGLLLAALTAAVAAPPQPRHFDSAAEILKWITDYRGKPDPARAAVAIHDLAGFGELRDPEAAGVYLGFAAGVLAANPDSSEKLVDRMLPMPAEDQWLVVRAIAYSGIPQWRALLGKIAPRVPARGPLLQRYVAGKLPVLAQFKVDTKKPGWFDRVRQYFPFAAKAKAKPVVLGPSPELLDTFWGYYYATGDSTALSHIMAFLPLSNDRDDAAKLMLGGMAKYTLAQNATRDPVLLATIKTIRNSQPRPVRPVLDEVITAADDVDVSRIRGEVLASIDDVKRKGPASLRNLNFWGQVGEGAIAAGCLTAAATGQVAFGLPCVVGGAVSSAALRLWTSSAAQ